MSRVPLLGAACLTTAIALTVAAAAAPAESAHQRTNVIVLVADGMGYNHVDLASLYQHGKATYQDAGANEHLAEHGSDSVPVQPYQSFDTRLSVETGYVFSPPYDDVDAWGALGNTTRENPNLEVNVTDSAAAATAMSTGVRTRTGHLGIDRDGQPLTDMVDIASENGLATGVVSSARFWTDTSAGFAVHTDDDDTEGIIDQLLRHDELDVVMGGGHPLHNNDGTLKDQPYHRYFPEADWAALNGRPPSEGLADWTLVDDREGFQKLAEGFAPSRVLGIAPTDGALFHDRPGDREVPFGTPMSEDIPRLDEMATASLNTLSNASDTGFFVMIEAATVDSAGHAGEAGRTIEEMVAFNKTVEAAVDWVERESSWEETTVIVTSDHETGNLWGAGALESQDFQPLTGEAGRVPDAEFTDFTDGEPEDDNPHYHTLQLVPFYAKGAAAADFEQKVGGSDPVRGSYLPNTGIAEVVHAELRNAEAPPEDPDPTDPPPEDPDPTDPPPEDPDPTDPAPSPSPDPTPTTDPTPAPRPDDGPDDDDRAGGGLLPDAGADIGIGLAVLAGVLLAGGGAALLWRRLRH